MTFCVIGKVLETTKDGVLLQDSQDSSKWKISMNTDESLQEGQTLVVCGTILPNGDLRGEVVNHNRFLDPLYEADLMKIAARFNFDSKLNPFEKIFDSYVKKEVKDVDIDRSDSG